MSTRATRTAGLPARPGWALAALAVGCLSPATAAAAPAISGGNGDVWNAARPAPTYVITDTDDENARIDWEVPGVASGRDLAPVTVRLPGLGDGSYRLIASRRSGRGRAPDAERRFRVDVTPPRITIRQPSSGADLHQGATVLADYSCQGAVSCAGEVAPGAPLDTSRAGPASFTVRAVNDAANQAVAVVAYEIEPATLALVGGAAADLPSPSPSIAPVPPSGAARPATIDARRLRPYAGAVLTSRRPILRWPAPYGVRRYNVQIFRLRAESVTKVVTAFPRLNRMRVPPRRLAYGDRYVWRVWPFLERGYPTRPLALSFFDVRHGR